MGRQYCPTGAVLSDYWRPAQPRRFRPRRAVGSWAYSAFAKGALEPGDLEEATNAALAVGDFDVGNAQHHGSPTERHTRCSPGTASTTPQACER
jgi:hypothetical protein